MNNLVKLYLYERKPEFTLVETFEAKSWDDFMIIKIKAADQDEFEETIHGLSHIPSMYPDKQVIMVRDGTIDIEFYGVAPQNPSLFDEVD